MMLQTNRLALRPVRPGDLDRVLNVYRQCEDFLALGPVSSASIEMVQADLELSKQEGGVYHVILDRHNGEILGVFDFVFSGWEGDPHLAFLSLLMIAAPYRARGFGSEVVQLWENELKKAGEIKAIQSGVQVNNPDGIRFWQRMGYRIVSGPELQADTTITYKLYKEIDSPIR